MAIGIAETSDVFVSDVPSVNASWPSALTQTTGMAFTLYGGKATWDKAGNITKYYDFGGQRVATRKYSGAVTNVTVSWLHGDQLGSVSVATDGSGTKMSELRYTPYGSPRNASGNMPTNQQFTGMPTNGGGVGLVSMGAREYDPLIGRFISADTIVPGAGNPQAFNRYSYTRNNPLNRIDPSGHGDCNVHSNNPSEAWCRPQPALPVGPQPIGTPYPTQSQQPMPLVAPAPINVTPAPGNLIVVPPPTQSGEASGYPQGTGLPNDGWEWNNNWPGQGPGWQNGSDPDGAVWRPDVPRNTDGRKEGENPHWQRRVRGQKDQKYPPNPEWGRNSNDRKNPGTYNPKTGRYDPLDVSPANPEYTFQQYVSDVIYEYNRIVKSVPSAWPQPLPGIAPLLPSALMRNHT